MRPVLHKSPSTPAQPHHHHHHHASHPPTHPLLAPQWGAMIAISGRASGLRVLSVSANTHHSPLVPPLHHNHCPPTTAALTEACVCVCVFMYVYVCVTVCVPCCCGALAVGCRVFAAAL